MKIISSDSDPLPRQKVWRVIRKVRFSNPLAHLDPNFHLKKQQHESRREAGFEDEPAVVLQQTLRITHRTLCLGKGSESEEMIITSASPTWLAPVSSW